MNTSLVSQTKTIQASLAYHTEIIITMRNTLNEIQKQGLYRNRMIYLQSRVSIIELNGCGINTADNASHF